MKHKYTNVINVIMLMLTFNLKYRRYHQIYMSTLFEPTFILQCCDVIDTTF